MTRLTPLRSLPKTNPSFKKGDVLVLFGELFQRGYANGIVEEASRQGMTIVRATVGRRDKDGELRRLTEEESAAIPAPFINIPLEAGFDLEEASDGLSPVDRLKEVKLSNWEEAQIDFDLIKESQTKGVQRFKKSTHLFLEELEQHITPGANVLFVHLMAGGIPRAKIVMPLMNRIFKGRGERYLSSKHFWESDIGRLCEVSFREVTAESFRHLVEESAELRSRVESQGGQVRYAAYGYHGTEVLIKGQYLWQSYTPYLQGWAKSRLEYISQQFFDKGIRTCVFNCPEILTNSSSIFLGVEVSLYPLLEALQKEGASNEAVQKLLSECQKKLKPEVSFEQIKEDLDLFLSSELIRNHCDFTKWPQHSSPEQMEKMLAASESFFDMHLSEKDLITNNLSEVVFSSSGHIMLHESFRPSSAVWWLGHDIIAKGFLRLQEGR